MNTPPAPPSPTTPPLPSFYLCPTPSLLLSPSPSPSITPSTQANDAENERIRIEWVIDVHQPDDNTWLIGTAYAYIPSNSTSDSFFSSHSKGKLDVCIPDNINPTFQGEIDIDYKKIRMIECVCSSKSLFVEVLRESVVPVFWDVEFNDNDANTFKSGEAVYLIRLLNKVVCLFNLSSEFVEVDVDKRLKLVNIINNKDNIHPGIDQFPNNYKGTLDFKRLVKENEVSYTPPPPPQPTQKELTQNAYIKNLTSIYMQMRRIMRTSLTTREASVEKRVEMVGLLVRFVYGGDLNGGVELLEGFDGYDADDYGDDDDGNGYDYDDGNDDDASTPSKSGTNKKINQISKMTRSLQTITSANRDIFKTEQVVLGELEIEIERVQGLIERGEERERMLLKGGGE